MVVEVYNGTLCIRANWLFGEGEVMTKSNYDQLINRNIINTPRRGCLNTPALVAYNSLPERFKSKVVEKLGKEPSEMVKQNIIIRHIRPNAQAQAFFNQHRYEDKHLTPTKQRELYTNAILLDAIGRVVEEQRASRRACGISKINWQTVLDSLSRLDPMEYPHTLPNSERRMREKLAKYKEFGYQSLLHAGAGNNNAAKIDDHTKESVIIELIGCGNNLDNAQIARLYNQIADKLQWDKITSKTVDVWRQKTNLITHAGRHGANDFRNKISMQVKRSAPSHPMTYWTLDGWDAELLYQETSEDKNGNAKTTYHNRLTIVVVLDPCVKYPIGFAIGTHETPALIIEALRNAVNHTAELFGDRHRAVQIQSDRYAIKTLTPIYEALSKHFTPARAHNAKGKVIEPYFKYLNKKYCQLMLNWSGFGVTSKKANQPNGELLNMHRKNFPDMDGCKQQLEMIMQLERKEKQARYSELWASTPQEYKLPMPLESYLYLFGESTKKNMLEPQGLTPTIYGTERFYDSFDMNFRKHDTVRWTVKYDPNDLSKALAVSEDGTLKFMLYEKHIQPMALAERSDMDSQELKKINAHNKSIEQHVIEQRSLTSASVRQLFMENFQLNDTLSKLLIVDSQGQHKDNKSKARLQSAKKEPETITETVLVEDGDEKDSLYNYRSNY